MSRKIKTTCCVVLCGGLGTRISQITKKIPKPMIKIFNRPIIFYILKKLLSSRFEKIILPLGYKGMIIQNYINKNFKNDLSKIKLIKTGKNIPIGNRIKKIKNDLIKYDNFLMVNGDTIFDANLNSLINFHNKKNNYITLTYSEMNTSWGSFFVNKKKRLNFFSKNDKINSIKKKNSNLYGYRNSGISLIKTECLNKTNLNAKDFEIELFNKIKKKQKVELYDLKFNFWHPIETISDYKSLNKNYNLGQQLEELTK